MSDDLAWKSVSELALMIRQKKLSPVELMDHTIDRIEKRNPSLNAFVFTAFDEARQRAKEAEAAVTSGAELGPLHGIPSAIKDLFNFKPGWPATLGGIRAMKDFRAPHSSLFVERMEKAGAIFIGRTNAPVLGFRGVTDNYMFGPTGTPFDATRNSGGSSGGGAAAVADGLVPMAEGSDGGGSIRIPASFCGVYGFKAAFGRAPLVFRPDAFTCVDPFIHEGPLTRTVEDAALTMTAQAGYDPRDPYAMPYDDVDWLGATRRSIKGMRVAYTPDFGYYPVDPEVAAVVKDALQAFRDAGAIVDEVEVGIDRPHYEMGELWAKLIMPLNLGALRALKGMGYDLLKDHRDDIQPELLAWLDWGMELKAYDHCEYQAIRTECYDRIQAVMANYDLLVSPTLACLPPENARDGNTLGPAEVNGEKVERLIGWCMTYLMNFTGHPAASIPAGLAPGNLPVGLQIIGRRWADSDVLAASAAFERARPWHDSYRHCEARPLAA